MPKTAKGFDVLYSNKGFTMMKYLRGTSGYVKPFNANYVVPSSS